MPAFNPLEVDLVIKTDPSELGRNVSNSSLQGDSDSHLKNFQIVVL